MAHLSLRNPVCVVTVLLGFGLLCSHAAAGCCTAYSSGKLPISRIKGYTIQKGYGVCDIDAIIFHTVKNRQICSDPKEFWVVEWTQLLRERVRRMALKNTTGLSEG